jgi:hypothetical protein
MGGVYNTINLHLYHYAGNNPVKYTDPDGRDTVLEKQLIGESLTIVEQVQPNTVPLILTGGTKLGGWGVIALFLMSLQGDSINLSLPANYTKTNNGIVAPNGVLIATINQAWKHIDGSDDWDKVEGWGEGSFGSENDSLLDHFDRHGAKVGAFSPEQYLYKAKEFAKHLKGARYIGPVEGVTPGVKRWVKHGLNIDIAPNKDIISFGEWND